MANKIIIDVFKEKKAEEFTAALASPDSKAGSGIAAAYTAAMGNALIERVAKSCLEKEKENERLDYIVRNAEILRSYMVNSRARKEGGAREIEASIQTASCIEAEIVNMAKPALEFIEELSAICAAEDKNTLLEAAELIMTSCRVSRSVILSYAALSTDDTYRYVTRRENEIFMAEREELYASISSKLK